MYATRDVSELLPNLCVVLVTYLLLVGCCSVSAVWDTHDGWGNVTNAKRAGEQETAACNVGNARTDCVLRGKDERELCCVCNLAAES